MSRLNKNLVQLGVTSLIQNNDADFIERFSAYLADKPELIDYFFDGPIPINDEIKQKIEAFLKRDIPTDSDFLGITEITIGFNWNSEQVYNVKYKVKRYFNSNNEPYNGQPIKDDLHPICCERILDKLIEPNQLN